MWEELCLDLWKPGHWGGKQTTHLEAETFHENCYTNSTALKSIVKPQRFYDDYIFLVLHICRLFAFLSVFVCGAAVQGKSTGCYLLDNKEETPAAGVKTFTEQLDKNKRLNSWLMKNPLFLFVLLSSWLTV